jgi:transcriptional regulator with XRE-family HTH domain
MTAVYPETDLLMIERTFVYSGGMGYRGKVVEREEARRLRALGITMPDIATALGVSRSSVSLWTRDVPVVRAPRRRLRPREPNALERRKAAEIADLLEAGRSRIGSLSEREFLVAGAALYAGEGSKTGQAIGFANTNAEMVGFFCAWLRRFFDIDERRLRVRLYLHQGLDIDIANAFWSSVTAIPIAQFRTPYRADPDPSRRHNKHAHGCVYVSYSCSRTHRAVLGLVRALLRSAAIPG